jgi:hypothetical protein
MRITMRIGAAVVAGLSFGFAIVVSGGGRPAKAESSKDPEAITCTVPPVTCTVPSGTPVRSAVAGTWNIEVAKSSLGVICGGLLHLSGGDSSLTGAVACGGTSGPVTGDLVGGRLRLNLASPRPNWPAAVLLVDATVAADGKSATGVGVGFTDIGFANDYSVTLAAQP